MPTSTTKAVPTTAPSVILLTGERFFVRRIPLVADVPIEPQVELALETISPFSLEQIHYGHVVDSARRHALVFAAYRRNFSADEQAAWVLAQTVLPDFLIHAVAPEAPVSPTVRLRETETMLEAVAWDEASPLPALILHRPITAENREQAKTELRAEIIRRTGIATQSPDVITEPVTGIRVDKGAVRLSCGTQSGGLLTPAMRATADVRDKAVLAAQLRDRRRSLLWGNTFVATIIVLIVCVFIELATFGTAALLKSKQAKLAQRAPEIQSIESAQNLATKMEKLASQQLRPFEMLAVINAPRPPSVEFLRVSTVGPLQLEIDAQTANAGDLRTYEAALKILPSIASVAIRDPRSRSGRTTFAIEVNFKPQWNAKGDGS